MIRGGVRSCIEDALPFAIMLMVECGEVGMITLGKEAMNGGMSKFVYIVYSNVLGTTVLLPFFIIHSLRSNRPPLTFSILCRFFALGLLGICLLQVCAYTGVEYSSPTLATAMGNLVPAFTFLLAIIFRMERLDLRKSSSQAKSLGTVVAISGAFVMTFYKGPSISVILFHDRPNLLLSLHVSNWVLGAFFLVIACILGSTWNVLQTATVKEYPDELTVVFFYCCFGTIQCAIYTSIIERNPAAWVLRSGVEITAVVFAGVIGSAFRSIVLTWCLRKKGPVFVAMFKPISMVIAVIMGIIFLGDTLHLGSIIGAIIIALGFYTVMWGKAKESYLSVDVVCGLESSSENDPLLQK